MPAGYVPLVTWQERCHDHDGGFPSATLVHCTQVVLTLEISPNVGNLTSEFVLVGVCICALRYLSVYGRGVLFRGASLHSTGSGPGREAPYTQGSNPHLPGFPIPGPKCMDGPCYLLQASCLQACRQASARERPHGGGGGEAWEKSPKGLELHSPFGARSAPLPVTWRSEACLRKEAPGARALYPCPGLANSFGLSPGFPFSFLPFHPSSVLGDNKLYPITP